MRILLHSQLFCFLVYLRDLGSRTEYQNMTDRIAISILRVSVPMCGNNQSQLLSWKFQRIQAMALGSYHEVCQMAVGCSARFAVL